MNATYIPIIKAQQFAALNGYETPEQQQQFIQSEKRKALADGCDNVIINDGGTNWVDIEAHTEWKRSKVLNPASTQSSKSSSSPAPLA